MSPTSYRTAPPRDADGIIEPGSRRRQASRGKTRSVSLDPQPFLRALPKVQLHCHLEGTVRPATLRELAVRVGLHLAEDCYRFETFAEFLLAFQTVCKALDNPDAFARVAREYVEDAVAQGVRYAELFISPSVWTFFHRSIDAPACVKAIRDALRHDRIEVALICDVTRNFGPERAQLTAKIAADWQEHGVIGIGLGGDEKKFPAALFAESFALARRNGLHVVAHAGEVDGAQSVRDAIDVLGAERIGHGIRSIDDPELIALLVQRRIPLEVCPTSNRRTGACAADLVHPIAELDAAGVVVTLDVDDPAMFGCTLLEEYALLERELGRDVVIRIGRNGIEASFADRTRKAALLNEFEAAVSNKVA
jgi:adenosine deaminase